MAVLHPNKHAFTAKAAWADFLDAVFLGRPVKNEKTQESCRAVGDST